MFTAAIRTAHVHVHTFEMINPLNPELNPICYLLALLSHYFLHVSRIRVKSLTLRLLISYIYIYIYIYIYDISNLRVNAIRNMDCICTVAVRQCLVQQILPYLTLLLSLRQLSRLNRWIFDRRQVKRFVWSLPCPVSRTFPLSHFVSILPSACITFW